MRWSSFLVVFLAVAGCGKPKAPVLHQVGAIEQPKHRGEPLLTLAGGSLPSPVVVPLWFEPAASSPDELEKCSLSYEAFFLELADGSVYVGERDPYCGGDGCRILDPKTRAFVVPEGGCVVSAGIHTRVEAWGRGVVVVRGDSEGTGVARVGTYTRADGFRRLLEVDLGHTGTLEGTVTDRGIELRSPCPLLHEGCALEIDYAGLPVQSYLLVEGKLSAQ